MRKILIVDDNADNISALKLLLEDYNDEFEFLTAQNGRDALAIVEKSPPEIILLDIRMPEMDGYEVCRKIKSNSKLPFIPLIFVTAYGSDKEAKIKGLKSGCDDFLSKPIDKPELFAKINNLLKIKSLHDEINEQNFKLEKLVEERTEQLIFSEKLTAAGQLASGVAHEFNNILAIIQGNAQIIKMDCDEKNIEDIHKQIRSINEQIERGKKIVNDMLSLDRQHKINITIFNLSEMLDKILSSQAYQIKLENIIVKKKYFSNLQLTADKSKIEQVLINIIINARHSMLAKGSGELIVSAEEKSNIIEIKISDTGSGMDDNTLKKIFLPFFTTKGARANDSQHIKGTGLGLSVSNFIIEKHNGKINVDSKIGEGTVFTIILPLIENFSGKEECEQKKTNEISHEEKSLKILLVDDETELLKTLTKYLRQKKFTNVAAVSSGTEALNLINNNVFDVIVLDLMMPEISGKKIIEEIKKTDNPAKIIVISGQIDIDESKLDKEIYCCLQKPFNLENLNNILNEICSRYFKKDNFKI